METSEGWFSSWRLKDSQYLKFSPSFPSSPSPLSSYPLPSPPPQNELQYQDAVQLKIPETTVQGPEGVENTAIGEPYLHVAL